MTIHKITVQSFVNSRGFGYLLAALGATFFSMKAVFVKLAYGPENVATPEVDAITLLTLRMLFALPVYIFIGLWAWRGRLNDGRALPTAQQFLVIGLIGAIGYYLASYLDFLGLVYITAQFERIILYTYPFFVFLLGVLFFGATFKTWMIVALVISYSGIALIFFEGATAKGDYALLGAILVVGAAFSYALHQLLANPYISMIGSRIFTCIAMSGAAFTVLCHFALENSFFDLFDVPERIVYISFVIAIFSTVLPSFLLNAAIGYVGPQAVAMIATISPVMAIVLLGEPFGYMDAIGTLIVILGVGLFTYYDKQGPS